MGSRRGLRVRGVDGSDLLSVATLHELIVDEETNGLGVLLPVGSCKVDGEIRHLECCCACESSAGGSSCICIGS